MQCENYWLMCDKHMSSNNIWQCLGFSVREHNPPLFTELAPARTGTKVLFVRANRTGKKQIIQQCMILIMWTA